MMESAQPQEPTCWEHFNILSSVVAECKLCGMYLHYLGQESNLMNHLTQEHPNDTDKTEQPAKKAKQELVSPKMLKAKLFPPPKPESEVTVDHPDIAELKRVNYLKSLEILKLERDLGIPFSRFSQEARNAEKAKTSDVATDTIA